MVNELRLKVLELVGLHKGNHGRTCGIHEECGRSVVVGTQLMLRFAKVAISEEVEILRDVPAPEPVVKKRGRKPKLLQEKVKVIKTRFETVVNARIWIDGVESCLVGYVSKAFVSIYGRLLEGRILEITALHSTSQFECNRLRSDQQSGLARGTIIG